MEASCSLFPSTFDGIRLVSFLRSDLVSIVLKLTALLSFQKSLERKSGALTGSQRQRGMYLNAGSQDAGKIVYAL